MRATNSITSKQNLRGLKSNSLHIYIVKIFKIFAIMGRTRYVVRPNSAYIVRITGIVAHYGANEIRRSPQLCTYRPHYRDCCALWGERDMSFAPTLHISSAYPRLLSVIFTAPRLWAHATASFRVTIRSVFCLFSASCVPI